MSTNQAQVLYDINTQWGVDMTTNSAGDLSLVTGIYLSNQRIYRRLMTIPGSTTRIPGYIWHPNYGAGLPLYVGQALSSALLNQIKSVITSQIFLESTVAKNPVPIILIQQIQSGIFCQITYTYAPTTAPVTLQFNVSV